MVYMVDHILGLESWDVKVEHEFKLTSGQPILGHNGGIVYQ